MGVNWQQCRQSWRGVLTLRFKFGELHVVNIFGAFWDNFELFEAGKKVIFFVTSGGTFNGNLCNT